MAHDSFKRVLSVEERSLSLETASPAEVLEDKGAILRSTYRKVDIRLLGWYTFVHMVLAIESFNITNAAIMNLEEHKDIRHQLGNLSDVQWAAIIGSYLYLHIMFEPFSTLLLKRFTPRTWMSRIMLTWGIITMCVGATKNFGGLFACRLLLGLAEAGFGPGVMFHLSFWYPTDQLPFRIAIMSALTVFSASLSGLLGYGVSFMNGQAGLAGWRWLFIFSGAPAILCGLYTMIRLPNYPETATFLTPAERMAIQNRLPKSQPSSTDKTWSCREVKTLFKDYSTYTFLLIWTCHAVGAFGVVTVLPTVIYELGLSSTAVSQLMTMPPAVIGAGCLMLIAWQVQRRNIKSWLAAAILESLSGACNIVLIIVEQPLVRYVFIVLSLIFAIGVLPILWPERIKATSGTTSAGLAIGLTGALASLRGIVGPYIWMQRFGPSYRTSFSVSLALIGLALVGIAATRVLVNRKTRETEKSGIVTSNSESSQDSIPKAPFARPEKLRY